MHLLLPKMKIDLDDIDHRPFFYVAGPIRGGGDWQEKAYEKLDTHASPCLIATPCRYGETHPLYERRIRIARPDAYERQTDWEDEYMKLAALNAPKGCLMFWLPRESATHPRPKADGPYAQDSYGELGYWRALLEIERRSIEESEMKIVIGAEDGFPGLHKLRRDFDRAVSGTFTIHPTLDETVAAAVAIADAA